MYLLDELEKSSSAVRDKLLQLSIERDEWKKTADGYWDELIDERKKNERLQKQVADLISKLESKTSELIERDALEEYESGGICK